MILGIYGASGLGTEFDCMADLINEAEHRWEDIVYVDDDPKKAGTELTGMPVLSFAQAMERYGKEGIEFIIAIGEPEVKDVIFQKLLDNGCEVTNLLHPDLRIPKDVHMGKGILMYSSTLIPPNAHYGNNVLIQGTSATGHNLVAGDNVVISSLVFVGGDVTIGRNTYIAPGSTIRNGIHIGENAIVGLGSVVTKDVPDNAVVYGCPAKIVRYNDKHRVFSK